MKLEKSPKTMAKLFDTIAQRYDFLNDVITLFGIRKTRKFAVRLSEFSRTQKALDLATGTGDFAFLLYKSGGNNSSVIGVDISKKMLAIARIRSKKYGYGDKIKFIQNDINNLFFPANQFDVCTISFGIRNVPNSAIALKEILRVAKSGGKLVIIEITPPTKRFNRYVTSFYFDQIVPKIAKLLSANSSAYEYLAQSVQGFPTAPVFAKIIQEAGWKNVNFTQLYFGAITIFTAVK